MKLKLEDFRTAFAALDYVQANNVVESSQFVRLRQAGETLTLNLTGILWAEAELKGQVAGGKWTAYADRRMLKAFLDTAAGASVEVYYKDKLTLVAGQRLEIAPHATITGYESWTPNGAAALTDGSRAVLKLATRYLPALPGTEYADAVYYGKGYGTLVTDTLFMVAVLDSGIERDVLVPGSLASILMDAEGKLATGKAGAGVVLTGGCIFQPALQQGGKEYPLVRIKSVIGQAVKAPVQARLEASELLKALRNASEFLLDKTEGVTVVPEKDKLALTVELAVGKFQCGLKASSIAFKEPLQWPAKKLLPWVEYAAGLETKLEFTRLALEGAKASVFRFVSDKARNIVVFADM